MSGTSMPAAHHPAEPAASAVRAVAVRAPAGAHHADASLPRYRARSCPTPSEEDPLAGARDEPPGAVGVGLLQARALDAGPARSVARTRAGRGAPHDRDATAARIPTTSEDCRR